MEEMSSLNAELFQALNGLVQGHSNDFNFMIASIYPFSVFF